MKKFKRLMIISIFLAVTIAYIIIYLPMKKELEKKTLENFILIAQTNERIAEQYIERCMEGTASLSSRTSSRQKIINYKNGVISLNELQSYTKPTYFEGVKVFDNIMSAFRVVDNQVIASYGEKHDLDLQKINNIHTNNYDIINSTEELDIVVVSPIKNQDEILGYDIVYFDMKNVITLINEDKMEFNILSEEEVKELNQRKAKHLLINQIELTDDGLFMNYVNPIEQTGKYFYMKISDHDLYESVDKLSIFIIIGFIVGILVLMLLTNLAMVKSFRRILLVTEESKDRYKRFAMKDTLTGAYSRFFYDKWAKKRTKGGDITNDTLSVVLIDLDDFKHINDTYGHLAGDQALKQVAKVLQSSIREGDFVIRYGGDEFLLLFNHCEEHIAQGILKRIFNQLISVEEFNFPIFISYGIQEVKNSMNIYLAVQHADSKMYEMKKANKKQD